MFLAAEFCDFNFKYSRILKHCFREFPVASAAYLGHESCKPLNLLILILNDAANTVSDNTQEVL